MKLFHEKTKTKNQKPENTICVQKTCVVISPEIIERFFLTTDHQATLGQNSQGETCLFVKSKKQHHHAFFSIQSRKNSNVFLFTKGKNCNDSWNSLLGNYATVSTTGFSNKIYGDGCEIILKKIN